jgi:hypothetical protein
MQGESLAARANVFLTRAAPRPTNISTKSDPEQYNRGTPAVAAVARASIVLPGEYVVMMIEFCRVLFFMSNINWSDNQCVAELCKKKKRTELTCAWRPF